MELTLAQVIEVFGTGGAEAVTAQLTEAEITDEQLSALLGEARDGFTAIYGDGTASYSADDAAALEQLAGVVEALAGEETARTEAAAARTDQVQQLAARAGVAQPDGDDGDDGDAEGNDGDGGEPDGTGEPGGTAGGDSGSGDTGGTQQQASGVQASSARRRVDVIGRLAAARSRAPQPPGAPARADGARVSLVAAADVPGIATGAEYADLRAVALAAVKRLQAAGNAPGTRQFGLAVLRKEFPAELQVGDNADQAMTAFAYAADESRLPGGSLVAAGGWCSPSETVWDFFPSLTSRDGLITVPEVQLTRGGIRWPLGPDFAALFANTGFTQTETQAIANTAKPCYEIPCNSWDEERLDLIGLCIRAGILMNASYPELIAEYLAEALNAHAHRIAASTIARIVAKATAVDMTGVGDYWDAQGATSGVLEAMELQTVDLRTKRRMADASTVEAIAPMWLRSVIRNDLAKRNNADSVQSVTNAQIDAHFADRGARVQWVYNYQDAMVDAGAGLGGATPADRWPAEVEIIMYPAGTFVRGTNDVITLDTGMYDSTLLTTNKYQALFTEEGIAVVKRGPEARRVTIGICASGVTAAPADLGCTFAP